ncbi:hypothetical protein V8J36_09445 [Frigidibacter sp. MR17.14]|uniref:HTH-like domain-containing protein n=1 Tax=Frigidibacter sp. MR17.14 TaxID=3126509 RepID=UPI0030131113
MSFDGLVAELRADFATAAPADRDLAVQIFGIRHAAELGRHSPNAIAHAATGLESYGIEIRRGMRLAPYVLLRVRK